MKKIMDQKGMSLMELMIAISVSTVIALTLFIAMRTAQVQMSTSDVSMAIETSGREGLYRMLQEIRESAPSRISITNSGATITFNVPNPSSPVTAGYAVNWPGYSIQYTRGGTGGNQLIRTNSTTNATSVIANDVTALSFTGSPSGSPSTVTVTMSMQKNLTNGRSIPATALSLTGQAKVRNA